MVRMSPFFSEPVTEAAESVIEVAPALVSDFGLTAAESDPASWRLTACDM